MRSSISDYYHQNIHPKVRGEILRESDEQILGSDSNQLKTYYYDRFALKLIEEDTDVGPTWEIEDYLKNIPASQREWTSQNEGPIIDFPCQRVRIELPIKRQANISLLSGLSANTISLNYSDSEFEWNSSEIRYTFETRGYGFNRTLDDIATSVSKALESIRQTIARKNADINDENNKLKGLIISLITDRKQKIIENTSKLNELTNKITIPLKKKDAIGTRPIKISERPLVKSIKPDPHLPTEYVLDQNHVNDIIEYLDSQARTFEQASKSVRELGEEALRDLLLASLNIVFQGAATGETFSKEGKSDIYLRIDKGNILICECKIWGGKALYQRTIDQLRSYLTWRHNYGIVISFVRNKNFANVIKEAQEGTKESSSYLNGFKHLNGTHFVSHHWVDDRGKEVILHHLLYHLLTD